MVKSYDLLKKSPVNKARLKAERANSMWLWGEGVERSLTPFTEKYKD